MPDFALTRDQRRVYLEVAGYWRPGYRERKARKLLALDGAIALVVAAPEESRGVFGALEQHYPFLWYQQETISAPALLATLLRAYDDFPARLAALDLAALLAEVERRGHIAPTEAQAALHAFTRAEVAAAVAALAQRAGAERLPAPEWVEGLGLCAPAWLDALAEQARALVVVADGRMPLTALGAALRDAGALGEPLAEAPLEALAGRAGLRVSRASLFAAEALTPERAEVDDALAAASPEQAGAAPRLQPVSRRAQPRKGVRRTSSGVAWSAPAMFPSEAAGDEQEAEAHSLTPPPQADT